MSTSVEATVTIDLTALKKYGAAVDSQLHGTSNGPVAKAIRQWGFRYRSWAQERFDKFSKGGGDWPDLAESTKRARRQGKGKKQKIRKAKTTGKTDRRFKKVNVSGTFSILRDIGLLFAVVSPTFSGQPGALEQKIPFGIRIGFGGPSAHGSSKATIADIASYHQAGKGHLPKREIIVAPPAHVTVQMSGDMERALRQLGQEIQ